MAFLYPIVRSCIPEEILKVCKDDEYLDMIMTKNANQWRTSQVANESHSQRGERDKEAGIYKIRLK